MNRSTHLSMIGSRARSARLRTGIAMIAFALAGALVAGPIGAARAQEGDSDGVPDDARALEIDRQATYTYNLGHTVPPSVSNTFPPQAICLVIPDACSQDTRENITNREDLSLQDTVEENQPEDTAPTVTPTHFAAPGDLPLSILAGAKRHEAAVKFALPDVPEGHQVDEFRLFFTQTDPTFHADSPMFRQSMVAALQLLVRQDPSEAPKLADRDPLVGPFPDPELFNGLEVCPITAAFETGENQAGAEAPKDSTESDDPTLECGFGANGTPIAVGDDGVVWAFDLTLAANAWVEGDLANEGILIRPIGAPNLAHGDPDGSTSEQITLVGGEAEEGAPEFSIATSEKPEPITFGGFDSGTEVQGAQAQTFTETFGGAEGQQQPVDRPAPEPAPPVQQAAPAVLSGDPVTEWWVWLLLPIFLAGAYLTAQGLTAEPMVAAERAGAMTRLVEARRAAALGQ